jgi:hypothetical protein
MLPEVPNPVATLYCPMLNAPTAAPVRLVAVPAVPFRYTVFVVAFVCDTARNRAFVGVVTDDKAT